MSFPLFPLAFVFAALVGSVSAAERQLAIDPAQSRIEVVVKATVDSFTGRLDVFDPTVKLNDAGEIVGARVAFHFRDVHTGKAKRDAAMHEWQETERFPDGEFELLSLKRDGDAAAQAVGRLTFHGVSREIAFPVSLANDAGILAIDGEAPVDVRDFGLPVIRKFGVLKVDPLVRVRFHLQGRIAS